MVKLELNLTKRPKKTCVTYWLNKLQNLDTNENYFLTLNPIFKINENKIIKKVNFTHPYLNIKSFNMQKNLKNCKEKNEHGFPEVTLVTVFTRTDLNHH